MLPSKQPRLKLMPFVALTAVLGKMRLTAEVKSTQGNLRCDGTSIGVITMSARDRRFSPPLRFKLGDQGVSVRGHLVLIDQASPPQPEVCRHCALRGPERSFAARGQSDTPQFLYVHAVRGLSPAHGGVRR